MLDGLISAFTNAATGGLLGGVVGLAGTWLKGREERTLLQLQQANQIAMRELDIKEMSLEADLKLKQTQVEIAGKQAIAETEADAEKEVAAATLQGKSYENDKATYSSGWTSYLSGAWAGFSAFLMVFVDFSRGMIRPTTTIYLLGVESYMAWALFGILKTIGIISPEQASSLLASIVQTISFLTVTAVTWYFGSRPTANRGR